MGWSHYGHLRTSKHEYGRGDDQKLSSINVKNVKALAAGRKSDLNKNVVDNLVAYRTNSDYAIEYTVHACRIFIRRPHSRETSGVQSGVQDPKRD